MDFAGESDWENVMRILFKGVVHPTTLAKSLKRALAIHGHEVGIRTCEQHVAVMTGYVNWHELRSVCEQQARPSPDDRTVGPEVAYARKQQYIAHLSRTYGIATATALVTAIKPTGPDAMGPLPPDGADDKRPIFPSADGVYPYAFAHRVTTDRGDMLVRSMGQVRIPYHKPAIAFSGDFMVPKQSEIPRPALTRLDIHAVKGALYSRLEPILGGRLPAHFGRADELLDILSWRKEPAYGTAGHPMDQALNLWHPGQSGNLGDHVCPPEWEVDFHNGGRDPHYVHAKLYGGLHSMLGTTSELDAMDRLDRHQAAGPPIVVDEATLAAKGVRILKSDGERISKELAEEVDGNLALVGEEVMLRTPEPCWKLAMTKGGDLRLDLHLSANPERGDALEPILFFALDEKEACDRAIDGLMASARKPRLRTRGTLDTFSPSACRIDGYATSVAYLVIGLGGALRHASKLLSPEAALVASEMLEKLPPDRRTYLLDFASRGDTHASLPDGILDGWERLMDLAGEQIVSDSTSPWLARLAGHGAVLKHLMSEPGYEPRDEAAYAGPAQRPG